MKERPILFKGEMVNAILNGTKTQTRRIIKPQPDLSERKHRWGCQCEDGVFKYGKAPWEKSDPYNFMVENEIKCPYGKPVDRLWVRERQRVVAVHNGATHLNGTIDVTYEADGTLGKFIEYPDRLKGTPEVGKCLAYGGYRESSRIDLLVKDVRVERLQYISRDGAVAEGVDYLKCPTFQTKAQLEMMCKGHGCSSTVDYIGGFRTLWDSINAKTYPWKSNPWVWVVEFERIK